MNSTQLNIVKALIEQKKYDVITEYTHIAHPDKGDIIVKEYAGTGVRVYKDNDGNTRVLCPKDIDTVQEGHVAQAIANGTIFDDADEIDRNATMIERTSIPYDAMVNSGKDTPKQLKPMIAIVIGRMDDNGSFDVSDADRTNGVNFVHDLCDKEKCPNTNDVVDNYLEKDKGEFYSPEMGKSLTELDNEVDDIVETKPEDIVSDDDTVDSYDDYDMDTIESDPTPENEETESDEEDGDNDDDSDDPDGDDSDNDDDESEDNESSDNDDEEAVIEDVDDEDDDDDYVEEGAGIAVDTMRGENIKMSPDDSYHSGSDKAKEKKKAIKLTSNNIVAKSEDLKNAMKGDFIRCVDKDGKVKLVRITVGKGLIDKNEKVKIAIDGESAKITVVGNDNKSTTKKKPKLVRTPSGHAAWVDESVEECGDIDTVQEDVDEMTNMTNNAMNKTPIPNSNDVKPVQEEVDVERARNNKKARHEVENFLNYLDNLEKKHPEITDQRDKGTEDSVFGTKPVQEEDEMVDDGGSDDAGIDTGDDSGDITEEACSPATGATTDSPTESTDAKGNVNTTPMPMSAQTKAIVNSNSKMHQEGFLSKKPKKLKPIGRDVVAYITCEMNDIRSANDQAMLAGYTCSKIELVDFYLTVLDTQDARYIVPHNKQYLTQMKNDLEKLLTQILRIRPINRSEQIWRVNYPGSAV